MGAQENFTAPCIENALEKTARRPCNEALENAYLLQEDGMRLPDPFAPEKNNIVTTMFVDTADQNYLIARWAYHRGMFGDFFWNAAHCLEKYLKAALILNGHSATSSITGRKYDHDLLELFKDVGDFAGDLLPKTLKKPSELKKYRWDEESLVNFLTRFNQFGDANNRYNMYGYVQRLEDLHHFDQAAFAFRRIAFRLDACPFIGPEPAGVSTTVRDFLASDPRYTPRGPASRLDKLLTTTGNDELRDAGLKLNFVLAPEGYEHGLTEGARFGWSASNPVLYIWIIGRVTSAPDHQKDLKAAELADWVLNYIQLPKAVRQQVEDCSRQLRARLPSGVRQNKL